MKAIICTKYGKPDVLEIKEINKPNPKDNEVLVKIIATAVNSGDVRVRGLIVDGFLRIVMRFVLGFNKPRKPIIGNVASGIIEEIGKDVKNFKKGDEVFLSTGFRFGTYAEYIAFPENLSIAYKPKTSSFEDAAAIIFGGMTAKYFLEKAGISKPNQNVLIYGATGSVGCAAVEISKYYKANVTSVCSEEGFELVKNLGSDSIIIYTKQDFTKINEKFDIIFDAVGKITKKQCSNLLKENGRYITVASLDTAKETKSQLEFLSYLYDDGYIHSNIDRLYSFNDIREAHDYVEKGRKKGNVVIKVN